MAANYNRPKPVDRLAWRPYCVLRIGCVCGRRVEIGVAAFQQRHGLPDTVRFYQAIARLRCSACGAAPTIADVVEPGRRR